MAGRKSKKSKHPLAKGRTIGVRLNEQDERDLTDCAQLESDSRGAIVHEATLLRDLGMPKVRERLAELRAPALRSPTPRRSGEDRRQTPELTAGLAAGR